MSSYVYVACIWEKEMSKLDLVKYKAIDRGFTKKDLQRVYKKIQELSKDTFEGSSIVFNEIEELAMMLDEPIDYKLEYSLCRLTADGKIFFNRFRDKGYVIDIAPF